MKMSREQTAGADGGQGARQGGFTMVEVIIAIVILAFGLLGMAGATGVLVRQITLSDVAGKRNAAQQTVIERLRAADWENLSTTYQTGTETIGPFQVSWTVTAPSNQWGVLEVITTGPGLGRGTGGFPMLTDNVADTFTYRILR
jgi:prepilin-type N-terminal cleavage/methylation domain-containing protein